MLEFEKVNYKFVIIGAGPVGLYAAIRLGLYNQEVLVIDAKSTPGGQCSTLYKEKPVYDLPGIKKITGQELIDNLLEQFKNFNHDLILSTTITNIEKISSGYFKIELNSSKYIIAEHLILACGGGFYTPINLGISIDEKLSQHVHYSVENSANFANKKLAIFGGGDSAVDWTLMLSEIAESVALIHRGKTFRASDANVRLLKAKSNINILVESKILSAELYSKKIKITISQECTQKTLVVDEILVFFGIKMENSISKFTINPDTKNGRIIISPLTLESSIEKLYAIGDISLYEYKKHNLTTGFGQCVQLTEYISKKYL